MKKKMLAIIAALAMALTMVPGVAFAGSTDECLGSTECNHTAAIGTTHYDTLAEAINEAKTGDTIEVLKDINNHPYTTVNKSITIDFNNHTVTGDPNNWAFYIGSADADVVFKDGTINSQNGFYCAAGETTLENIKLEVTQYGIYASGDSKVSVDRNSQVISNTYVGILVWGDAANNKTPTLEVQGYVESKSEGGYAAISGNGKDKSKPIIKLNGANVKSAKGAGLYLPQDGSVSLINSKVEGTTGIGVKSGDLTIIDSIIIGNGEYNDNVGTDGSGIQDDGSALMIESNVAYVGGMKISISGNTTLESANGHAVHEIGTTVGKTNVVSLDVESGTLLGAAGKDAIIVRPETTESVELSGGYYSTNPKEEYLADSVKTIIKLTALEAPYTIGESAEKVIANAKPGDQIIIYKSEKEITVPDGVVVNNSTGHDIIVNDTVVTDGDTETAHTHNAVKTEAKAETCTEEGNTEYWYCEGCDKYFSDETCTTETTLKETVIPAKGHGETEIRNAKAATCSEEGYTGDKVCKDCGDVIEEGKPIDRLAHAYENGVCTVCGAKDPNAGGTTHTHNAVKTEAKAETCTEEGNTEYWYCEGCDKYFSDETCTTETTLKETVIPAKGHGETEIRNAKAATCTEEGYTGDKVCKDCGDVIEEGKPIDRLAHAYENGVCTVCGAKDPNAGGTTHTHNAVKTEAKAETCTEEGNTEYWYCEGCDKYFSDENCTTETTLKETVIPAKGHGETEIRNAKAATCTEEGYTGDKVCKDCGDVIEEGKPIDRLAHAYENGVCTVCGAKDPNAGAGGTTDPTDKPDNQDKPNNGQDKTDNDKTSQTGDDSNMSIWFALMLAAVAAGGTVVYRRKNHNN